MRINDNEEGTVDMDMLEENLQVKRQFTQNDQINPCVNFSQGFFFPFYLFLVRSPVCEQKH